MNNFRKGNDFLSWLVIATWLMPSIIVTVTSAQEFNYEVERRILDRLSFYLGDPVQTNKIVVDYRRNGGFENDLLKPSDRDAYLKFAYSLPQPLLYFGLENGQCTGYATVNVGVHREPGNGGYDVNDPEKQKHYKSCVNPLNGEPTECKLSPGDSYIECLEDDCTKLLPCQGQPTQHECSLLATADERGACIDSIKYCIQYNVRTAPSDVQDTGLGMIPLTSMCFNQFGHFSQDLGEIVGTGGSSDELGNCYYKDGQTLVNRNLEGAYEYCGGNGKVCNTTFVGGYDSGNYDPRYRPWYTITKELQRSNWSPPYPFFHLGMGVTYSTPIYSKVDDKQVFMGVAAIDYRFEDIANFLTDNYRGTKTFVAIFEDAEPNNIIGLSTGSSAVSLQLTSDLTQPCPPDRDSSVPCTPVRVPMADLQGTKEDDILVRAFFRQSQQGYPKDLLSVKADDDIHSDLYVSQSTLYEQSGANLKWRVIIVEPGKKSNSDAILPGATLFIPVVVISTIGFLACMALLTIFYGKRQERAVIQADWRFTCAFIFGCALFNLAVLTQIGPNNNIMCVIRMWSFHLFFVIALAPLFVKIWRMQKLVGSTNIRRVTITNTQTALYMLPMILAQAVILAIITVLDPPKQTEIIETIDGTVSQSIVCQSDSSALFVAEFLFEAGFILAGCVLAYMTRNMDEKYGESKQLIFAMYNIALVGMIIVIVINVGDINPNGTSVLMAVGVFWGTVFSSAAFVLPRMMEARRDVRRGRKESSQHESQTGRGTTASRVQVSGLESIQPSQFSHASEVERDSEGSGHIDTYCPSRFSVDENGSMTFAVNVIDPNLSLPTKSPLSARDRKRALETNLEQFKLSMSLGEESNNDDSGGTHTDEISNGSGRIHEEKV